jgi:hypothetical protein
MARHTPNNINSRFEANSGLAKAITNLTNPAPAISLEVGVTGRCGQTGRFAFFFRRFAFASALSTADFGTERKARTPASNRSACFGPSHLAAISGGIPIGSDFILPHYKRERTLGNSPLTLAKLPNVVRREA